MRKEENRILETLWCFVISSWMLFSISSTGGFFSCLSVLMWELFCQGIQIGFQLWLNTYWWYSMDSFWMHCANIPDKLISFTQISGIPDWEVDFHCLFYWNFSNKKHVTCLSEQVLHVWCLGDILHSAQNIRMNTLYIVSQLFLVHYVIFVSPMVNVYFWVGGVEFKQWKWKLNNY